MNVLIGPAKTLLAALILNIVLSGTAFCAGPLLNTEPDRTWPDVAAILRQYVDIDKRAPAVVVGTIDASGQHVFGYGRCCGDSARTADRDTLFEIGSITKSFTSILLADMALKGEVELDDPVVNYLPASMQPKSDIARSITLRQLATHTSGLPTMPDNFTSDADYTDIDMGRFFVAYAPARGLDGTENYSNIGYALLGYALAHRAGKPYTRLIEERILLPLDMNSSCFADRDCDIASVATGHDAELRPVPATRLQAMNPAGGLRSTADDMLLFLSANLGIRKTPIARTLEYAQALQQNGHSNSDHRGLAFGHETVRGISIYQHDGSTRGFYAFIVFDPVARRGVVALANSGFRVVDLAMHVLVPEYPLVRRKTPVELPEKMLRSFDGEYVAGDGRKWGFYVFGKRIMMYRPQRPTQEVFAESPTTVFIPDTSISYRFDDIEHGRARKLWVSNPDGTRVEAHRGVDNQGSPARPVHLPSDDLKMYVGRYAIDNTSAFEITESDGRLFARLTGQDALEIFPRSRNRFFYIVVDAEIEFVRDNRRRISRLVLYQGGESTPAKKIAPG